MSDLNWCTMCDNQIDCFSDSLYCSDACLRSDALNRHPLLGYDYAELKNFPRPSTSSSSSSSLSAVSAASSQVTAAVETNNLSSSNDSSWWEDTSSFTTASTLTTPPSSPSSEATSYLLSPPSSPVSSTSSSSYEMSKEQVLNFNFKKHLPQRPKTTTKRRTTPSIFYI